MNEHDALIILARAKAIAGHNWKAAIRRAWFSGMYAPEGFDDIRAELQQIRNQFGPSWLVRARVLTTAKA